MQSRFKRWKNWFPQYRENLTLAIPVVLSQLGQVVVQLVDNAMVGYLGALPLAAVSFGGAVFTVFLFWGTGLTLGLTPLAGEQYARRDYRTAARFFQNGLVFYTVVGLLLFAMLMGVDAFLDRMGQSPEVVAQARPYYRYLAWSIIPFMIFGAFKQFLESIGNTRTGMVVVLSANLINVLLNYIFIYGNWGAPAMGAAGAGLATCISRVCMPLFILGYFLWNRSARRYFRLFSWSGQAWRWVSRLWKVGYPIAMQMLLEVSAFAFTSIMMGWLGTVALAAHQVVISMGNFVFMGQVGIGAATTILISHAYGVGNYRALRRAASASYHLSLMASAITMICFIVFRGWLPQVFTSDEAVIAVGAQLFVMAGLYQFSDGLQVISLSILRGMQDVRITMFYAFLSYVVINLPVGYLCAFTLGMGPRGLWVGFIVGLSTAAVLLNRRFRRQIRRVVLSR